MGKLFNGLLESLVDRWIGSDASRRYATSLITRGLGYAMLALLAWLVREHGLTAEVQQAILGHWDAIVTLVGPALGIAAVELVSKYRAKLNAKQVEVAVDPRVTTLSPSHAKAIAKVELSNPPHVSRLSST